jgi:hypothetical protein
MVRGRSTTHHYVAGAESGWQLLAGNRLPAEAVGEFLCSGGGPAEDTNDTAAGD